jgi:NAD(P)-dependent dehydrogenase (short-subunit alcohol dehydrogenase family)
MNLQLQGKMAIVTGGSAGIGLAIARLLAEEGVEVTIPGRDSKKLNEAIASLPGTVHGVEGVNSVLPGPTRSEAIVEFLQSLASTPGATPEQAEKEFFERHRPTSLIQRMAEDSEVASLVAYLASPLAAATNSAAIRVEGGILRTIF